VAGRYRALHQIVADVPDPIGDAYLRISKSWRSLSRQEAIGARQPAGLEAQSDELGGAGQSVATGIRALRGMIPVGAAVERCSAGAPADRDEDLLQALSPSLARTVPLLQVVPVRVNQEPVQALLGRRVARALRAGMSSPSGTLPWLAEGVVSQAISGTRRWARASSNSHTCSTSAPVSRLPADRTASACSRLRCMTWRLS